MTTPLVEILQVPNFAAFGKTFAAKRKEFYQQAMALVVADIVGGIKAQVDATGHSLPALEPETIERKGHAAALIHRGLLSDEYTYRMVNQWRKDMGEITIKPLSKTIKTKKGSRRDTPRDEVGKYLQIDGIDTKSGRKHFRFFGISLKAQQEIGELIDRMVSQSMEAI
jgi:hypothetical protein